MSLIWRVVLPRGEELLIQYIFWGLEGLQRP